MLNKRHYALKILGKMYCLTSNDKIVGVHNNNVREGRPNKTRTCDVYYQPAYAERSVMGEG